MGASVNVDTAGLRTVAGEIESAASEIKTELDNLTTKIKAEIGVDPSHTTWWGPQAGVFSTDYDVKSEAFDTANQDLRSCAQNLTSQASSWDTFEGV